MKSKAIKWGVFSAILFVCLIFAIGISLSIGELHFSLFEIPAILKQGPGSMEHIIIHDIRLPRGIARNCRWRGLKLVRRGFTGRLP